MKYAVQLETIKKCKKCGIEFHPLTSNQQFCKIECRRSYNLELRRKRYIEPLKKREFCIYCGKSLKPYGSQKFCDEECRRLYRNKIRNKSGRICDRVKEPEILKKCEYCGKDIPFNRNYASTYNKKKFCSRECCAKSFKEHRDNFIGSQRNFDEFKVIIKNINHKFIWQAFKGSKMVLKCENPFNTYKECKEDAELAF